MGKMKKLVCLIQVVLLVWIPFYAHAGPFEDNVAAGDIEGRSLVPVPQDLFGENSTTGDLLLFPGSSSEVSINPDELFPGQTGFDPQLAKDEFESESGVANLGDEAATALETEASSSGQAWRVLIDSQNNPHPDLRNDPIWGATDAVLAEAFSGTFQDCTATTNVIPVEETIHLPDLKTCQRLIKPTGACEVTHNYEFDNPYSSSCTPGATVATFSGRKSTHSYRCGSDGTSLTNNRTGVTIPNAYGQDFHHVTSHVNHGVRTQYHQTCTPQAAVLNCRISGGTSNRYHPNLGWGYLDPTPGPEDHLHLHEQSNQSILIPANVDSTYPDPLVDEWFPTSCIQAAIANTDGMCEGSIVCVDSPGPGPCVIINGVEVCEDMLAASPIPGISPLCRRVAVSNSSCDFNIGQMDCWVDVYGDTQCPVNTGGNDNTCTVYEDDPNCGYMRSVCIDGLEGPSGECYGWEDTYDCGQDVVHTTHMIEEFYECEGDTRCIESGGSGSTGAVEYNSSQLAPPTTEICHQGYVPNDEILTARHNYDVELIRLVGGEGSISSCGVGCLNVWVGTVGNNYWPGWCTIYEQETNLEITNTDAFYSVVIDRAKWDDYIQIILDGTRVWNGPNANFPPETAGACELSTSWDRNPNVDVTSSFQTAGPLDFLTRVSVSGHGEGYSHITALYDPSKILQNDTWDMSFKLARALENATTSGCTVNVNCVDDPIPAGQECGMYNGYQICKSDFTSLPPGLESISPSCRAVEVSYLCETSDTSSLTTCGDLENNGCAFMDSHCIPEFLDPDTGVCWLEEREYSCSTAVPAAPTTGALVCGVRCLGTECVSHDPLLSTDFGRAAGLIQVGQYMAQDMNCGASNANCDIFEGTPMECKVALGGWSDCCESPGGISLTDYINLLQAGNKAASAEQWLGAIDNPIAGTWNGAKKLATDGWDTVGDSASTVFKALSKPFTAAWEGIAGAATEILPEAVTSAGSVVGEVGGNLVGQASELVAQGVVQALTKSTAQWVANTFGGAVVDALFTATVTATGTTVSASAALNGTASGTTAGGGGATMSLGGSILGPIMAAYMIYVVLNILVNIIWKCEQEEFEFAAKRDLRVCHSLGSYCASEFLGSCVEVRKAACCFTSPMSRILQEQIRPQLGMSWGSARNPNCDGIPLEELENVDWEQVDLSEWMAILSITGNNPQLNPELLDIDEMTGAGNALNGAVPEMERKNVYERTMDRMEGYDPTDANENMSQGLYGY